MTEREQLDRAVEILQRQQDFIESLLAQVASLRMERDDARVVRGLIEDLRRLQRNLSDRLIGI